MSGRGVLAVVAAYCLIHALGLPALAAAVPAPPAAAGGTLSLADCVAIGLRQSPAGEVARQKLLEAREKISEAKGGYYPSFKMSAAYTATAQQKQTPLGPDVFDARLFARQTVYDAGATTQLVEAALHTVRAQDHEVTRTLLDITLAVKTAFYETLKKRDLLEVAQQGLKNAARHLEQAQASYQAGVAPRSDVIKVEVQVSSGQLEVIKAENALILARSRLATAMGLPATTDFSVAADAARALPSLPPIGEVMARAHAGRPELLAIRARLEAAACGMRQAESGLFPALSLEASYGWQEGVFVPDEPKWSLGLSASIPVFERLTVRAKINQAAAIFNGLRASEQQLARSIELEVQQAWLAQKEAVERLGVTKKALEQARLDLRVSEGRYREGIGNILELLDAQIAAVQAETNIIVATHDIALAGVGLDRATGMATPGEGG